MILFYCQGEKVRAEIGYLQKDEGKIYWVEDNGVGFDQGCADKLVGVFLRLPTLQEYESTGVGLAIEAALQRARVV